MTLKEIIDAFNQISIEQPVVREYIKSGNIYDLSSERNSKFGVFCVTQGTHTANIDDGYTTYNFFLYYVDRLSSDKSNKIEIQSTGLEVLKNIIRVFREDYDCDVTRADFDVFTERFSEECAGCYATISIVAYEDNCIERF